MKAFGSFLVVFGLSIFVSFADFEYFDQAIFFIIACFSISALGFLIAFSAHKNERD